MEKLKKELVLVKGLNHRNSHVLIAMGDAHIICDDYNSSTEDKITFVVKNGKAKLVHPEHGTLFLKEGTYTMHRQIEYNPFSKRNEFVYD